MQVNPSGSQNNSVLGLSPAANEGAIGVEGSSIQRPVFVREQVVHRWHGSTQRESMAMRTHGYQPAHQGGWLSRIRQAIQGWTGRVEQRALQRHAALMPQGTYTQSSTGWLHSLSGWRSRLSEAVASMKAQLAAPVATVNAPAVNVTPAAQAGAAVAAASVNTSDATALASVTAAVHQRFAAQASNKEAFNELLHKAFGNKFDAAKAETIRQQALAGDFSWAPKVEVVSSQTLADRSGTQTAGTALGAYAQETDTIYISRELLHSDPSHAGRILMEEMGHGIDARINTSDAVGDEGEIFSKLMHGDKISAEEMAALKADNDTGVVNINGREVKVEYGWLSKAFKAVTRGISRVAQAVVHGVQNLAKATVNVVVGLATMNFDRVRQGFQQGFTAITTTIKEVHQAVKDTAKELHKIAKEAFQKLMQSKLFAAVLMICRFIPIPIVQLVVRIIDIVRAAYMVYQGIKNKSLAMVLGGVASLASGAGKLVGSLGASTSTVTTIQTFADGASKLSMAYNAVANKDLGSALGLLGGMPGVQGTALSTAAGYAQQAMGVRDSVRSGDGLGALGGALGFAGAAYGGDKTATGQQLGQIQDVVNGARALRELDRGHLDSAQSLAQGTHAAQNAGNQADNISAQQRARQAQEQAAQNRTETVSEQEPQATQTAKQADKADEAQSADHRNGSDVESDQAAERNGGTAPASTQTRLTVSKDDTLIDIARAQYGENWKAGLVQIMVDNNIKLNQWGSPVLREGRSLVLNDISGKSEQELKSMGRDGGNIVAGNSRGLQAKADLEERVRQAAAEKKTVQLVLKAQETQAPSSTNSNATPPSNSTSYVDGLDATQKWRYAESLNAKTPGEKVGVFLSNSFASGALDTLKASSAFINHPLDTTGNVLKSVAEFSGDLFGSAFGEKNSQIALARRMEGWWDKNEPRLKAGDYANMAADIPLLPPVISGRALLGELGSPATGTRVVIGPWREGVSNIVEGATFTQCGMGSCVAATGQVLTKGAVTEQHLVSKIGEWSTPEALAAELNKLDSSANWKGGWLGSEADALKVANTGRVGVVLQAPGSPAHMVTIEPISNSAGKFLVHDTGAGATYQVTADWVKKHVVGGVWK